MHDYLYMRSLQICVHVSCLRVISQTVGLHQIMQKMGDPLILTMLFPRTTRPRLTCFFLVETGCQKFELVNDCVDLRGTSGTIGTIVFVSPSLIDVEIEINDSPHVLLRNMLFHRLMRPVAAVVGSGTFTILAFGLAREFVTSDPNP